MQTFLKLGAGAGVLGFILVGYLFFKPTQMIVENPDDSHTPMYGAASGPDVSYMTFFHDNVNIGGQDFATTSAGAVTYTAASIVKSRVIEHIASGALTATLPTNAALSALGFLPNVGDSQTLFIHASTTAITLAGSSGVSLFTASSTKKIASGEIGRLEFVRLGATEGRLIEVVLTIVGN